MAMAKSWMAVCLLALLWLLRRRIGGQSAERWRLLPDTARTWSKSETAATLV